MKLEYNNICVRNAEPADCEQLAAWWNDGRVMAHAGFPNGIGTTADEVRKKIAGDSDETTRRMVILTGILIPRGNMNSSSSACGRITSMTGTDTPRLRRNLYVNA